MRGDGWILDRGFIDSRTKSLLLAQNDDHDLVYCKKASKISWSHRYSDVTLIIKNNCSPDALHIAGYRTVAQRGGIKENIYHTKKQFKSLCNLRVTPLRHEIVSVCLFEAQLF
jgi:hypothetical protein